MSATDKPTQWRDNLEPSDERDKVTRWRYQAARHAGLSKLESRLFADGDQPTALLRELEEHGCPVRLIARICI